MGFKIYHTEFSYQASPWKQLETIWSSMNKRVLKITEKSKQGCTKGGHTVLT